MLIYYHFCSTNSILCEKEDKCAFYIIFKLLLLLLFGQLGKS